MRTLPFTLPLFLSAACVSSADHPDPDADAAGDVASGDTALDGADGSGPDAPGADTTPEAGDSDGPDTATDTLEDVTDGSDAASDDAGPEAGSCEVVGDECDPASISCAAGEEAVVFCSRCGFELRRDACAALEVCDEDGGAGRCRACTGDECPILDDCAPSSRTCLDYNTVQICDPTGHVDSVADCPAGRRCFSGSCGPTGGQTGADCTTNLDPLTGCAGSLCVCGDEFVASAGAAACGNPGLAGGYCSTADCPSNGCDPGTEVCADFAASDAFGGGAFCVTHERCSIRGRTCGANGLVCEELPTRDRAGTAAWAMGCWAEGPAAIGEVCTSDEDCLGGDCRTQTVGGALVSYCAARCGADAGCPSYAACVDDPDTVTGYVCLAVANDTACPRLESEPLNIAPTPPFPRYGRGSVSVCYFAR